MTAILVEWLLRSETLALTSVALLVVCGSRPIARYLDREALLEGEIDFTYGAGAERPQ